MGASPTVARLFSIIQFFTVMSCSRQEPSRGSVACVPATQELRAAIARQLVIHGQGKIAKDLPAVIGILAEGIQVFPDDGGVIRGRAALEATYRDLFTRLQFDSLTYLPQEVRDCGAVLVELGEAQGGFTPLGQASVHFSVRYLHLWEHSEDAGWLLALAMDQPLTP